MPPWLLLLLILVTWFRMVIAGLAQKQRDGAARGLPRGKRGGVSWIVVIPLVPMVLWGIAQLGDLLLDPWGTVLIGSLHAVLAVNSVFSFGRDIRQLRLLDKQA